MTLLKLLFSMLKCYAPAQGQLAKAVATSAAAPTNSTERANFLLTHRCSCLDLAVT